MMASCRYVFRRTLSTQTKRDIGQIFAEEHVRKLLKDITRFSEEKIFARHSVDQLESPKFVFMTDHQIERAKQDAYENAKASMQMPPVMSANKSEPAVLDIDEDMVGYTKYKVMFVDISPGISNKHRLMSVREPDGALREPTYDERTRLNHMFYPNKFNSIDTPKMFSGEYLDDLMKRKEYKFVLDKACIQFEPDDSKYVEVTSHVYKTIDDRGDYDSLRSTRHFGPMALYLAYESRIDNLLLEMLTKKLVEDAAKLVRVYNECHNIRIDEEMDDMATLKYYSENNSVKKHNFKILETIEPGPSTVTT